MKAEQKITLGSSPSDKKSQKDYPKPKFERDFCKHKTKNEKKTQESSNGRTWRILSSRPGATLWVAAVATAP